ncbi:MAG: hypothetical protein ACHQJ6_08980 [Candidatus Berkiellales bacterium]
MSLSFRDGKTFSRAVPLRSTINIDLHSFSNFSSVSFIAAQVIWWGMGIYLFYDFAETILHWPHLLVVALYSSLMIASTWFGMRTMLLVSIFSIPAFISMVYISFSTSLPETGLLGQWFEMISLKSLEYFSWLLLVMASFAKAMAPKPVTVTKKFSLSKCVALLGFGVGIGLMLFLSIKNLFTNAQTDMALFTTQQLSNIFWIWGLATAPHHYLLRRKEGLSALKDPRRVLFLLLGTLVAVLYTWGSLHMGSWWQYPSVFIPTLTMMLLWR